MITNLYLKEFTIVVRYCWIEEPYWIAFINHYYSLGVLDFNVLIQYEEDKKTLEGFNYPKNINIKIHLMPANLTPNQALVNFDLLKLNKNSKFVLLVDADEFIFSFNKNINLSKLIDKKRSLDLRWLMCPITNEVDVNSGYLGGETKPIASFQKISRIKSCHNFQYKPLIQIKNIFNIERSIETTKYGLVLIHHWSRSLIDCLLKSSFSKTPNEKTIDQKNILQNLKKGKLNSRAKYLAFLDIQKRYINGLPNTHIKYFDREKEKELILKKYSQKDLNIYIDLYNKLKEKLLEKNYLLGSYPPYKGNIITQMKNFNISNIYD